MGIFGGNDMNNRWGQDVTRVLHVEGGRSVFEGQVAIHNVSPPTTATTATLVVGKYGSPETGYKVEVVGNVKATKFAGDLSGNADTATNLYNIDANRLLWSNASGQVAVVPGVSTKTAGPYIRFDNMWLENPDILFTGGGGGGGGGVTGTLNMYGGTGTGFKVHGNEVDGVKSFWRQMLMQILNYILTMVLPASVVRRVEL